MVGACSARGRDRVDWAAHGGFHGGLAKFELTGMPGLVRINGPCVCARARIARKTCHTRLNPSCLTLFPAGFQVSKPVLNPS